MERILKFISTFVLILAVSLILLFSASIILNWYYEVPTAKTVEERFNQKFPDYQFIHADTSDGHSDWVVYYVQYKKPGDERIYEAIWEYYRRNDKWETSGGEGKIKE